MSAQAEDTQALAASFAGVAEEYDRGRPAYPAEAIDWLLGEEPLDVLDLAAGTGKLTRSVLARAHRVTAVEPLDTMRAVLAESTPEARALAGTAEEIPLPDHSVDAVVVGSAFHWFDHQVALKEILRVLRPPGVVGVLSNRFRASEPWVANLPHVPGPGEGNGPGNRVNARALLAPAFESIDEQEFAHEEPFDLGGLQDLAISRCRVAVQGDPDRRAILAVIAQAWHDNAPDKEQVTVRWGVPVVRARGLQRHPGAGS